MVPPAGEKNSRKSQKQINESTRYWYCLVFSFYFEFKVTLFFSIGFTALYQILLKYYEFILQQELANETSVPMNYYQVYGQVSGIFIFLKSSCKRGGPYCQI